MRQKIDRIYWYTIEVGLCLENGQRKAYGATQLSSFAEINSSFSNYPQVYPFDLVQIMATPVQFENLQEILFILPSFDYLEEVTEQIKTVVDNE